MSLTPIKNACTPRRPFSIMPTITSTVPTYYGLGDELPEEIDEEEDA